MSRKKKDEVKQEQAETEGVKRDVPEPEETAAAPEEAPAADTHDESEGETGGQDARIKELTAELEEVKDKYLRQAAEFDNFRKRMAREHETLSRQAAKNIMEDLLVIIDTFELALDHAKTSDDFDKFHQGIEMLHKQLTGTLGRYGLARIEAKGKEFDPNFHEAVSMIEDKDADSHTVIDEMQAGYLLNEMVLRASKVIVSK